MSSRVQQKQKLVVIRFLGMEIELIKSQVQVWFALAGARSSLAPPVICYELP